MNVVPRPVPASLPPPPPSSSPPRPTATPCPPTSPFWTDEQINGLYFAFFLTQSRHPTGSSLALGFSTPERVLESTPSLHGAPPRSLAPCVPVCPWLPASGTKVGARIALEDCAPRGTWCSCTALLFTSCCQKSRYAILIEFATPSGAKRAQGTCFPRTSGASCLFPHSGEQRMFLFGNPIDRRGVSVRGLFCLYAFGLVFCQEFGLCSHNF